ncbi:Nitrosoguanidine resistance protein SNG1 [Candida viswanathii]|uniref:Nitrosoguanidine resistance protein SNG1 n=1 Tax=Candida viswanathii TaxID=5486 RepID=A0A367YL08_9ASCO|nr:Nitrosoguanidine resistance protein SNG1 [Candida viswanathii]
MSKPLKTKNQDMGRDTQAGTQQERGRDRKSSFHARNILPKPKNRPSIAQRLSSASAAFFSVKSRQENDGGGVEYDCLNEDYHETLYATQQMTQAFNNKNFNEKEAEEETPEPFTGKDENDQPPVQPPPHRRSSISSSIQKYKFWDKDFKHERVKITTHILMNYIFLIIGFAGVLCIYTGSYYQRSSRLQDLKMGVFIADQNVGDLPNIVGQTIEYFFTNVSTVQAAGDFHIWNHTRLADVAASHNNTITEEVYRQIHHQKFWAAFYVYENATLDWYQAMVSQSQTFNPAQSLMEAVYETGRDLNGVNVYIVSIINELLQGYNEFIPQSGLVGKMLQTLNSTQVSGVINNAPQLITVIPTFAINDLIPVSNPVFAATMQLGGIYIVVMTFFLQVFCFRINLYLASKLSGGQFILSKLLTTQISYLFISLAFIVLNTAFQLPFSGAFGHSGFLVIWMFAFLLMSSIGSLIEILVLVAFALKPALLGFVLLYMVVLNISPVLAPIALCPSFYRYGYTMPLKNFYDLVQVAYFDSWKGIMGRNIGILIAWVVVTNAMMPFVFKWLAKMKAKKEAKAKAEK